MSTDPASLGAAGLTPGAEVHVVTTASHGWLPDLQTALHFDPPTSALLIGLLSVSFFFCATETALFSLQKVDRTILAKADPTSARVVRLLGRRQALSATLLMGYVTANVAIATTTAAALARVRPDLIWVNLLLLTPVLVLVGEITPKVLGYRHNRAWSRAAAWPLTLAFWGLTPVRVVFSAIVAQAARLAGANPDRAMEGLAEEELRALIDHGTAAGELDPKERDMIEAVFEFDDLTVERLMTPRPDLFAVPLHLPWDELLRRVRDEGYSRIPVYAHRADEIVGVLLLGDLLKLRRDPPSGTRQLRGMLLPPVFVPASKSADALLREFLEKNFRMAFVVDEHGALVGLITLDDLLQELVGEMESAGDGDGDIARPTPGTLTVKASMDVEDFGEQTGIELPEGDYHTLAGFVFQQLGRLPRPGDQVRWQRHVFTITAMEGRRIAELGVRTEPLDGEHEAAG